jgi:Conserved hypothetical protein (DUF2461)
MAFHGWPVDAIEFFRGLEANNTKDYWQRHLDAYERVVRRPMEELLTELEPDFGPGRVLRPYCDVRFSRDKSPYKTSITAQLGASSWISLAKDGLGAGAGRCEPGRSVGSWKRQGPRGRRPRSLPRRVRLVIQVSHRAA